MPFFSLAVSSITAAFFSPSRDYLTSQVRKWCFVYVGIGVGALIAGLLQVTTIESPCLSRIEMSWNILFSDLHPHSDASISVDIASCLEMTLSVQKKSKHQE